MNHIFRKTALAVFLLFTAFTSFSQNGRVPLEDVVNAIRTNRVQDIDRYFDNFVPININNSQTNYSHNQAGLVLRDFFDKNPPSNFKIEDSGAPDNSSKFVIATFSAPSGNYELYVVMKLKGKSYLIKEIKLTRM